MADVNSLLKQHLENIKTKIAQKMASEGRNATGRSVASLKVEVGDGHATLWGSKSFLVMERGRGPGPIPAGFTEIIMQWAKAKGISVQAKANQPSDKDTVLRSFAGAVAYNIMKKGTKLYRDKRYNDIFTSVVNDELEQMGKDMSISLMDEVTKINQEAV